MKCINCGKELVENEIYCSYCGAKNIESEQKKDSNLNQISTQDINNIEINEIISFDYEKSVENRKKIIKKEVIIIVISMIIILPIVLNSTRLIESNNTNLKASIFMIITLLGIADIFTIILFIIDYTTSLSLDKSYDRKFYIITKDDNLLLVDLLCEDNQKMKEINKHPDLKNIIIELIIKKINSNKYNPNTQYVYKYSDFLSNVNIYSISKIVNVHRITTTKNKCTLYYDYTDIITNENYKNKMLNFYKLYKNEELIYPIIKKISTNDTIAINSNEEIKYKYLVKNNLKKTLFGLLIISLFFSIEFIMKKSGQFENYTNILTLFVVLIIVVEITKEIIKKFKDYF